jgi:flagellar biosynthesis protein FlhB
MPDYPGEKSLEPTPHRRQQARQEGQVAKSHDLSSAVMLLAGLTVLLTLGGSLVAFLLDFCRHQLGGEPSLSVDTGWAVTQWNTVLWALGRRLLPILGLLLLAGVAVNVLQTGFLFLPQRVAFDLTRLSPLGGLRRMSSGANFVHFGFGILKLLVVAGVSSVILYGQIGALMGLTSLPLPALAPRMAEIVLWTALKIGAALLVLAVLDYAYQRWRHERDLRMTPQELREELRNLEGNPDVIARRKQLHRDLTRQRSSSAISAVDAPTQADGLKQ